MNNDNSDETVSTEYFGPCIAEQRLKQLRFDFDERCHDPTKEHFSPEFAHRRKMFYRKILASIFHKGVLSNTFIAGTGLLIKYAPGTPDDVLNESTIDIYVRVENRFKNFKVLLNPTFQSYVSDTATVNPHGVVDKFIDIVKVDGQKLKLRCNFSTIDFETTLSNFSYEPCKIGFKFDDGFFF